MFKEWLAAMIGTLALFGAANTSPAAVQASQAQKAPTGTEMQCLTAAVIVREETLASATATYGKDMEKAYTDRSLALQNAYSQSGILIAKEAVKDAWTTWNAAVRVSKSNWKNARDVAWRVFKASVKACGPNAAALADHGNESQESAI